MSITQHHSEWLSLMSGDVSGPFLTMPVLEELLPNGLDTIDSSITRPVRQACDDWISNPVGIQHAWVNFVLQSVLEFPASDLVSDQSIPPHCLAELPEFAETVRPDYALLEPAQGSKQREPVLLITVYKPGTKLEVPLAGSRSTWSPAQRMAELCKSSKVPLGLVTDGERWMLVHAPWGQTVSYVSWYASLWLEEPLTLRAFITLLHHRRFFGLTEEETLLKLMERSANEQHRVTDALGRQVRSAMTELLRAVDTIDRQATVTGGIPLIIHIQPKILYEAALTVMMRLVFLLAAEERGLLRLGEELYDNAYAASTLRDQLREVADMHGEEILEYRHDAWMRLLTLFRAVYSGIEHEDLRLPAYKGSLFDPDRYPFLEGRADGTTWRTEPAKPMPISNRVVLHLLESIQFLRDKTKTGQTEACRLSFRGLDVEQIGHVYEGLLDRTAARAPQVLLGLEGSAAKPEIHLRLKDLEERAASLEELLDFLQEKTGRSRSALKSALSGNSRRGRRPVRIDQQASLLNTDQSAESSGVDHETINRLSLVCDNEQELVQRIIPFAGLLRSDSFDLPVVVLNRGLYIRPGSQRRDTGTHYTPRALAETLVEATLEPHVYMGPEQGLPKANWKLRSPQHILSLKICDMAMGSGAFLVQACRYLAGKLAESWKALAREHPDSPLALGLAAQPDNGNGQDLLPQDDEERLALARRLVADRCLYGVDSNPLAVEMAKLSLWLVTLQRDRPFTFIDHALKCGDALLGVHDLRQLEEFSLSGHMEDTQIIFGSMGLKAMVEDGRKQRNKLGAILSDSALHVAAKEALHAEAERALSPARLAADILVMQTLENGGKLDAGEREILVDRLLSPDVAQDVDAQNMWREKLSVVLKADNPGFTKPFHWVLEFPEVFDRDNGGFDAIVGNPPFLGSQRMKEALGHNYREYIVEREAGGVRGKADLVAFFFLRAGKLLRRNGDFGLIATNSISQGDTREVGLLQLEQVSFTIRKAWPDVPWSGSATVTTSQICLHNGLWAGQIFLDDNEVSMISSFLTKSNVDLWESKLLVVNTNIAYQGTIVLGDGFIVTEIVVGNWLNETGENKDVLFQYMGGEELTTHPEQKPSRWIISFWDWDESKASQYKLPFQKVAQDVRPIRQRKKEDGTYKLRNPLPQRWWQYADKRPALFHALGRGNLFESHPEEWKNVQFPLRRTLVLSRVSKHGTFCFIPNEYIMSEALCVFASDDAALFAQLQSGIHRVWAYKMSSKMRTDLRYTPSSAFETFPRPRFTPKQEQPLRDLGETLHQTRASNMRERWIGLTALYNMIHDPEISDTDIIHLRELHEQVDQFVAAAYGWDDLDLSHSFHSVDYLPVNDRVRHTFSEAVRFELLDRLTLLNKERWEEEQRTTPQAGKKAKKKKKIQQEGPSLFDLL